MDLSVLKAGISVGLVLFGVSMLTLAVYGIVRMPDIYTSLHAASKIAVIGVIPILGGIFLQGNASQIARTALIVAFLILSSPVSGHVIGRLAYLNRQPMERGDTLDESGRLK